MVHGYNPRYLEAEIRRITMGKKLVRSQLNKQAQLLRRHRQEAHSPRLAPHKKCEMLSEK
jgi:phosphoglycerate-specific signal transduction histidine kinase